MWQRGKHEQCSGKCSTIRHRAKSTAGTGRIGHGSATHQTANLCGKLHSASPPRLQGRTGAPNLGDDSGRHEDLGTTERPFGCPEITERRIPRRETRPRGMRSTSVKLTQRVDVHTPKANVQYTTLDRKPLKSVRNRHQTNTILNTSHEPKSTTVLELKYRSYEMFTIIQEFTEKYRGFRGSLFSIHPLSGCERLPQRIKRSWIGMDASDGPTWNSLRDLCSTNVRPLCTAHRLSRQVITTESTEGHRTGNTFGSPFRVVPCFPWLRI